MKVLQLLLAFGLASAAEDACHGPSGCSDAPNKGACTSAMGKEVGCVWGQPKVLPKAQPKAAAPAEDDVIDVAAAMKEVYAKRSAAAAEGIFRGGPIATLFGSADALPDDLFELRRWNTEVAVKKYDYLLVGVCAPWNQQDCANRLRGVWTQMSALAAMAKNNSALVDASKAADVAFGMAILNLTASRSVGRLLRVSAYPPAEIVEIDSYLSADAAGKEGGAIQATFRRLSAGKEGGVVTAAALWRHTLAVLQRKRDKKAQPAQKASALIRWTSAAAAADVGVWGLQVMTPPTAKALVLDAAKDADVLVLYLETKCARCKQLRLDVQALASDVVQAGVTSVRFVASEESAKPRGGAWPADLSAPSAYPTLMLYRHGREPIEHMRHPNKANIIAFLKENVRHGDDLAKVPGFGGSAGRGKEPAAGEEEEESV